MSFHLKRFIPISLILTFMIVGAPRVFGQGPNGSTFGFGLMFPNPSGGSAKLWLSHDRALDFYIGDDYFGGPRIGGDYLWHFFPFNSEMANMYVGAGGAIGVGNGGGGWYHDKGGWYYRSDGHAGIGARVMVGVNVMPRRTPLELFMELGPLIGIVPGFGYGIDVALGLRFYP